ncbi:glycine-rich protein 3-like [Homarus americanus]|uniref:glycine-rich protein 3-like n=1 Tax=Homarus americanus TaxID=6706 RepID=UPI001C48271F|nr:glycine-rich protein 3-like [Homarus americanus]XP_042213287.1 glycine-rich protein 3-like [Homarus americanus]
MKFTALILVFLMVVSAVVSSPAPHKKGFGFGGKKGGRRGFGGFRPVHVVQVPIPVYHGGYGGGYSHGGYGGGYSHGGYGGGFGSSFGGSHGGLYGGFGGGHGGYGYGSYGKK